MGILLVGSASWGGFMPNSCPHSKGQQYTHKPQSSNFDLQLTALWDANSQHNLSIYEINPPKLLTSWALKPCRKKSLFFWSSSQWPVWHQTLQDCCRSCLCSSRVPVEDPYQTEWAETHQERRVTNATARHWFENCLDQQTEGTSYVTSLSGRGKKTKTHTLGNRFSVSAVSQTLCL